MNRASSTPLNSTALPTGESITRGWPRTVVGWPPIRSMRSKIHVSEAGPEGAALPAPPANGNSSTNAQTPQKNGAKLGILFPPARTAAAGTFFPEAILVIRAIFFLSATVSPPLACATPVLAKDQSRQRPCPSACLTLPIAQRDVKRLHQIFSVGVHIFLDSAFAGPWSVEIQCHPAVVVSFSQ